MNHVLLIFRRSDNVRQIMHVLIAPLCFQLQFFVIAIFLVCYFIRALQIQISQPFRNFDFSKEKSQELSIRPCKSVIFKVDLYMKIVGLCTISRLKTIVNEKMRLFNSTYIKAQRAQNSFHFRFDQTFLEIVTFERVLLMGARPHPSLFLL